MFCGNGDQNQNEQKSCGEKKQDEYNDIKKNSNVKNEDIPTSETEIENDDSKKLEEENKKLKDTLMRTLAELENTRRIAKDEQEKTMKYAVSKFAEDLIPTMENFHLAFNFMKSDDMMDENKVKSFIDGIKLTQSELKRAFEKNGLVRIYPVNEKFNPDLHDAIAQVESEAEEGIIVDIIQAGYKIKDRLLRPALVAVSKGKKEA